jgi:hypothetical protein
LISSILKKKPSERLSMEEIFSHEWLLSFESIFNINIAEFVENAGEDDDDDDESY